MLQSQTFQIQEGQKINQSSDIVQIPEKILQYPRDRTIISTKKLYKVDIRKGRKQQQIFKMNSAHDLRNQLQWHFIRQNKDITIYEVRYHLLKNEQQVKFQNNIKNKQTNFESGYNKFHDNNFCKMIISDLMVLEPPNNYSSQLFEQTSLIAKQIRDKEQINMIDEILQKLMKCYTEENSRLLTSNDAFEKDCEKLKKIEKIYCNALIQTTQKTYNDLKNVQIKLQQTVLYIDHCKQNSNNLQDQISNCKDKIKIKLKIDSWSIGTVQESDLQAYYTYFDIKFLENKFQFSNKSISLYSHILRDSTQRIHKFQIITNLFNGSYLKLEIEVIQIDEIYQNDQDNSKQINFYLRLRFPPKYFISQITPQLSQDISYITQWKRVQNFPILRNSRLFNSEIIRLHLINNTYLKIKLLRNKSQDVINLLYNLSKQFKIQLKKQKIECKQNIKNVSSIFNCEKFQTKLSFVTIQNRDEVWKLRYYILCLLSQGILEATHVNQLMNFIQQKKQYYKFIYIFDSLAKEPLRKIDDNTIQFICKKQTKGIDEIKIRFKQLERFNRQMLQINYDTMLLSYVFKMRFTPSGNMYQIQAPQMSNRLLREYREEIKYFLRVSIQDDSGLDIRNQLYLTKKIVRKWLDGFKILGRDYIPLGWSPSQLRNFSLWYIHQQPNQKLIFKRSQILNFLGQFSTIKPDAKKAARIGQNFSSSWNFTINKLNVEKIEDVKNSTGLLFSDGIGKISKDIINQIGLKLRLQSNLGVLQFRYKGTKGVVAIDPRLQNNTICLRPSMIKFQCNNPATNKYFDILDWNKYKGGYLNRQIIILLRTLGISDSVFLHLQNQYINDIKSLTFKQCSVFKQFAKSDQNDSLDLQPSNIIIRNLMLAGFNLDKQPFFKGVLKTLKKNGYNKLKQKSNINVKKSARIMGIMDQYQVLQQNQVYCCINDPFIKKGPQTISGPVIIVRNPCLHPGDIRKLNCLSEQEILLRFKIDKNKTFHPFKYYQNTIIFPQKGKVPVTSQISGSDLDGDHFFVCWDPLLIPEKMEQAYIITDIKVKQKSKEAQRSLNQQDYNKMLDFFVDFMNYQKLGKIANSHLVRADQDLINYARSIQCIQLAQAHGHAVDFPKSGYCPQIDRKLFVSKYPDFMEKQFQSMYESQSILGLLYRDIKNRIQNLINQDEPKNQCIVEVDQDLVNQINPLLQFEDKQIKQAILILNLFQVELSGVKYLTGTTTEFEIYTGNVDTKERKNLKNGKIMEQIINIKLHYLDIFFRNQNQENRQYYLEAQQYNLNGKYFGDSTKNRALLFYLVSYCQYFNELRYTKQDKLLKLKAQISRIKQQNHISDPKQKFMGFAWFIFPKVLIDIKKSKTSAEVDDQID